MSHRQKALPDGGTNTTSVTCSPLRSCSPPSLPPLAG